MPWTDPEVTAYHRKLGEPGRHVFYVFGSIRYRRGNDQPSDFCLFHNADENRPFIPQDNSYLFDPCDKPPPARKGLVGFSIMADQNRRTPSR
jgi:hypothetical protein